MTDPRRAASWRIRAVPANHWAVKIPMHIAFGSTGKPHDQLLCRHAAAEHPHVRRTRCAETERPGHQEHNIVALVDVDCGRLDSAAQAHLKEMQKSRPSAKAPRSE